MSGKTVRELIRNWFLSSGNCVRGLVALLVCLPLMQAAFADTPTTLSECGEIYGPHYGPYDYRTEQGRLKIVNNAHFTPQVEQLIRGQSSYIGDDISYTLRASPNHHRALVAMERLTEKTKPAQPQGLQFPAECWFQRAIAFRPDDTIVRGLYALYLSKAGRAGEAKGQLDAGVLFAKEDAYAHYNLGLVYFEISRFDEALTEAHKAMELGFERTELADKLKKAKKWKEPTNP